MCTLDFTDGMRDNILGWVPITSLEHEVIKTRMFNRLRYVTQMSLAYLTFSGAHHTRYEHSVGAMEIAYRVACKIPELRDHFKHNYDAAMQLLRLAALLHDVGHPPFSHAVEWVFKKNPSLSPMKEYSHDKYTKHIIETDSKLSEVLGGFLAGKEYAPDYKKAVSAVAIGDKESLLNLRSDFLKSSAILLPILNGDVDADKIDYILRDYYYCGFPTGVDIDEVVSAFSLGISSNSPERSELLIRPDRIGAVETLLYTRLRLISTIHHETRSRIANQMLMRVVAGKVERLKGRGTRTRIVDAMHRKWIDNDMYAYVTRRSFGRKKNPTDILDGGDRIFIGDVFRHAKKLSLIRLPPSVRADLFVIDAHPEHLLSCQQDMEKHVGARLHLDFCFVAPPPLTLQLAEGDGTRTYLFDASNVIKGVLRESFARSFVGIYSDSSEIDKSDVEDFFCKIVHKRAHQLRRSEKQNESMFEGDLILCVLYGIREFEKKIDPRTPLWAYGVAKLQEFVYGLLRSGHVGYQVKGFKHEISKTYDVNFFRELQRLVFCGLITERPKEIRFPPKSYKMRFDHRISSFGAEHYNSQLRPFYQNVVKAVISKQTECQNLVEECVRLDRNSDKTTKYEEFVKKITKTTQKLEKLGGCVLVP